MPRFGSHASIVVTGGAGFLGGAVVARLESEGAIQPGFLTVGAGAKLRGATIATRGDHRIAMAFSIAALVARGETEIDDAECADVSFPGFYEKLAAVVRS